MLLKIVSGLTLEAKAPSLYPALQLACKGQSAKYWGLLLKDKRWTGNAATVTKLRREQGTLASVRRWAQPEVMKGRQPTCLGVSMLLL